MIEHPFKRGGNGLKGGFFMDADKRSFLISHILIPFAVSLPVSIGFMYLQNRSKAEAETAPPPFSVQMREQKTGEIFFVPSTAAVAFVKAAVKDAVQVNADAQAPLPQPAAYEMPAYGAHVLDEATRETFKQLNYDEQVRVLQDMVGNPKQRAALLDLATGTHASVAMEVAEYAANQDDWEVALRAATYARFRYGPMDAGRTLMESAVRTNNLAATEAVLKEFQRDLLEGNFVAEKGLLQDGYLITSAAQAGKWEIADLLLNATGKKLSDINPNDFPQDAFRPNAQELADMQAQYDEWKKTGACPKGWQETRARNEAYAEQTGMLMQARPKFQGICNT